MKAGLAKVDITPRVGVGLSGFGPFINRYSIAVRDRLWARALALEQNGERQVLVNCDLIGVSQDITNAVRERVAVSSGLPFEAVMVHSTHTHSGPNTGGYIGWGEVDPPYLELLPLRLVEAASRALSQMQEARLSRAEVACEGVGLNREYDRDAPPLQDVLREDWRPAKPELTDTRCQVLRFDDASGRLLGFASYFGCHPVVCCAASRYIHGDYCGVATNLLERENPGAIGLFLQGAQGDVNSCCVHKSEQESLLALDVIAGRYARAVRFGLKEAKPVEVESIACRSRQAALSRKPWTVETVKGKIAEYEKMIHAAGVTDGDDQVRINTVYVLAARRLLRKLLSGESVSDPVEFQGFRVGPLHLLGAPFEIFQAIKNDTRTTTALGSDALVMGLCNDTLGYAPDKTAAARGGYAADVVPMILGVLPFARLHEELVREFTALAADLRAPRKRKRLRRSAA
jgi:hypothetical protein